MTCDDSGKEGVIGEAAAGEFPWQAILYTRNEERWEQFCSGFLIHPKFVLSGKYFSFNRYSVIVQDDIFYIVERIEISDTDHQSCL